MHYTLTAIGNDEIPRARIPLFQHLLDTYAGETNKVYATWRNFGDSQLGFKPHPKSSSVAEILTHQLLSERRFFGEFLGTPEPAGAEVLPPVRNVEVFAGRLVELARPRLTFLADRDQGWWLTETDFFDVRRERIWIFWRRILHTAHHRTQLTVYLRLLDQPVPSTYGPTADVTWAGADPTITVDAADRK